MAWYKKIQKKNKKIEWKAIYTHIKQIDKSVWIFGIEFCINRGQISLINLSIIYRSNKRKIAN